ncbi:MAG TPA: helix-turn-helix domain-containing protein [Candidatus Limnocylindrales bacterium]|nr:helix-turn-helix domain-containing protein [Candidatus Limnocylindrales bacterium]
MTDATQPAPATPDEAVAPDAERLISDVETLKAISDPLRLRILELMVTRPVSAWSVKELATGLEVPPTRLYHHIELLVERDLIRSAEQRVVSGIIETRYRLAALSLRLDPALVRAGGPGHSGVRAMLGTIFDETRRDLELIMADPELGDEAPVDRPLVTRSFVRLTPDRVRELRGRLEQLLDEYDPRKTDQPGAVTYRLLLAIYADPTHKEVSRG